MRTAKYEYYEAPDGWHWRLRAANGRVLSSGEAFVTERNVLRAIETNQAAHHPYGTQPGWRLPVRKVPHP